MGRTVQKNLILECFTAADGHHMTVDDVLAALQARGKRVGKATVYRFLGELERDGTVQRFCSHDGQPACFRYVPPGQCHHYHLRCDGCGALFHMELTESNALCDEARTRYGFVVDEAKTVLYGKCADCISV